MSEALRTRIEQSWCPSCREWSVIDAGRPCAFCDTILVKRKGGWKRPDKTGRITERMARAIHARYEKGVSARQLGVELHQVLGYATHHSAEMAIGAAFKRYGLSRRGRVEAVLLASSTHGLSPRDWQERYRRRRAAGLTKDGRKPQPLCAAVRKTYPRKGEPCSRPALFGSEFCFSHDPERRAERDEQLARMRDRLAA